MTVEFAVDTSDPTKFISQIAHSELELDQALELVDQFEPYAFCKALVNYINTPKLFGDDAKVDLFSFTLNLYKFCKKFHTLNSSVIDKDYISDDSKIKTISRSYKKYLYLYIIGPISFLLN